MPPALLQAEPHAFQSFRASLVPKNHLLQFAKLTRTVDPSANLSARTSGKHSRGTDRHCGLLTYAENPTGASSNEAPLVAMTRWYQ